MSNCSEHKKWHIGDVFTTTFWGVQEVCIIHSMNWGIIYFIRLESIRSSVTVKKDFCMAGLEIKIFNKVNKTFLHHSEWYSQYRNEISKPFMESNKTIKT